MDFSKSHCTTTTTGSFFDSDSEEDDGFLSISGGIISSGFGLRAVPSTGSALSPSFGTWNSSFNNHGCSTEICKNRNEGYDQISLVTKINKIIEENEKSIIHAVEVASASVTQLESRTRRLENSMDDLKICVEFNHGRTAGKLKELESILKEVHMDVKFLLDKQEIAETELQLLKLQRCRPEPEPIADLQTAFVQQKPDISNAKPYQPILDSHTSVQPFTPSSSTYANIPHPNYPSPQAPIIPSSPYLTQASEVLCLPAHFTSPQSQYILNRQQFEPYADPLSYIPPESGREQEESTLRSFRMSDIPSIPASTKFLPPNSSFSSQNSYDDFAPFSEGSPIKSSQYSSHVLPKALPKASFLDSDQSVSTGKVNKASNEEIVEEVIAMGFRRDMALAALMKLTQKQEAVNLNTLLDKLMN